MNPVDRLRAAQRCNATSKRTQRACQAPAERGKSVCRFHGARSRTPTGPANGAFRTGQHTKAAIEQRRELAKLIRSSRAAVEQLQTLKLQSGIMHLTEQD